MLERNVRRVFSLLLGFVLCSCTATAPPSRVPITCPEKGMQVYSTPRNFDGPGTVFRIDPNGVKYPVTVLSIGTCEKCEEAFADHQGTTQSTLGAVLQYLKLGSLGVNAQRAVTVSTKLQSGQRFRTLDDAVDPALKNAKIAFKPNNRYYLVRETTAFKSIDYTITSGRSANAELKADLATAIGDGTRAEGKVGWTSDDRSTLSQKFDTAYHVCFSAEEIIAPDIGLATEQAPERRRLERPIVWSSESAQP